MSRRTYATDEQYGRWFLARASPSGQAYVYVDGTQLATVDLKSSTTRYRDAIWTKTWSTSAKHTVKIVVVGTSAARRSPRTDWCTSSSRPSTHAATQRE